MCKLMKLETGEKISQERSRGDKERKVQWSRRNRKAEREKRIGLGRGTKDYILQSLYENAMKKCSLLYANLKLTLKKI